MKTCLLTLSFIMLSSLASNSMAIGYYKTYLPLETVTYNGASGRADQLNPANWSAFCNPEGCRMRIQVFPNRTLINPGTKLVFCSAGFANGAVILQYEPVCNPAASYPLIWVTTITPAMPIYPDSVYPYYPSSQWNNITCPITAPAEDCPFQARIH